MKIRFLRHRSDGPVGFVTSNRPDVNAVNAAKYSEIRELFSRLDEIMPTIRVLVLHAEGRHFCAGNDLDEFLTLSPAASPVRVRPVREASLAIQAPGIR